MTVGDPGRVIGTGHDWLLEDSSDVKAQSIPHRKDRCAKLECWEGAHEPMTICSHFSNPTHPSYLLDRLRLNMSRNNSSRPSRSMPNWGDQSIMPSSHGVQKGSQCDSRSKPHMAYSLRGIQCSSPNRDRNSSILHRLNGKLHAVRTPSIFTRTGG